MVTELFRKGVTLLKRILNSTDTISLLVITDQGRSYTQSCPLSYEGVWTLAQGLPFTLDVMIGAEDWQKLNRAGLAHLLLEALESRESYTPQQTEFAFMTLHKAEDA